MGIQSFARQHADIMRTLDAAGFAVVPKADLAALYHLRCIFALIGDMKTATLDAAKQAAGAAD